MKGNLKSIGLFFLLIPIFLFHFIGAAWTGSYIYIEENWKDYKVFTPEGVTDPADLYLADAFFYALRYSTFATIASLISFLMLVWIAVHWIVKIMKGRKVR